jgi:ribosome recycling factor
MVDLADLKTRMEGAIGSFNHNLGGLRTGRASTALVENMKVEVYGSDMPLNQLASINVPEARTISISVWDQNNVSSVEKAIQNSDLGLSPNAEGNVIRLNLPDLTEERRKELVKVAGNYAEQARVAVRNIRRDGMDSIKKEEKDGDISEDEMHGLSDEIQDLTDKHIAIIDNNLKEKEAEIMKV